MSCARNTEILSDFVFCVEVQDATHFQGGSRHSTEFALGDFAPIEEKKAVNYPAVQRIEGRWCKAQEDPWRRDPQTRI